MIDQGPEKSSSSAGAYRVLARKYRPRDFSDLIGQEPMVRTLTNAFAAGRIAQAWMLTGVRGVGKTTTARILARALNFKTPDIDHPTVDLAVLGEHCAAIMEGRHVDVIEMDAASHTGIDDIREIIEQVRYAPVSARYKVYIIDEVHMLSTQAFNGLLKTLEEPPPHVKFIFATTEIRKVPITVLSRCQRFDLRRVDAGVLADHLRRIAGLEGVEADDASIAMIARAAEGSVRDSLSIFDQAIAHASGVVTGDAVRDMLGLADRARIIDLFEKLMAGDVAGALAEFRSQYDTGADPAVVLTDLAEIVHLVTRLRYVPSAVSDTALTEDERTRGATLAEGLSIRVLSRAWQMLLKGIAEVETAGRPVSAAEMVLIRIAHAADLPTLDEALKGLEGGSISSPTVPGQTNGGYSGGLSGGGSSAGSPRSMAPSPGGGARLSLAAARPMGDLELEPAMAGTAPAPAAPPVPEPPSVPISSLADIAALADRNRDMSFKITFKRCVRLVRLEEGRIDVALTGDAPPTLLGDLTSRLQTWTGRRWIVTTSREPGGQTLAEAEAARREIALDDARSDPAVAAILARFPGARITDIRIPDEVETPESSSDITLPPDEDDDEF